MKIFTLPDLGEGLPDAQIREWYIKPGDHLHVDQPMVAMETAKALVDVPAPFEGTVEKLFGNVGDTINVKQPLIGFEGEGVEETRHDAGTVVGSIPVSNTVLQERVIDSQRQANPDKARATPKVRALARHLHVDLDSLHVSGERITEEDVKAAVTQTTKPTQLTPAPDNFTALPAIRRAMILSMNKSHMEVVPVTIVDDADISAWQGKPDISLRILRAVQHACQAVPILNASFDGASMSYKLNDHINVGMAVDTEHGLYVPVIKDITHRDDRSVREEINRFKQQAQTKSIPQDNLRGATIVLSNFGSLAGRYANPIIIPPTVAIIGVGQSRDAAVAVKGALEIHKIMPLSVTVDHRAITGGEAARFLRALMDELAR